MALTTIETRLISKGAPLSNTYNLGERVKYLTTAGEYSSGTLRGNAMPSISVNTVTGESISDTINITSGGFWTGPSGGNSSGILKLMVPVAGTYLRIWNPSSATGTLMASSGGTYSFYSAREATTGHALKMFGGDSIELVALNTTCWTVIGIQQGYYETWTSRSFTNTSGGT